MFRSSVDGEPTKDGTAMTLRDITGENLYRIFLFFGYEAIRKAIGQYLLRSAKLLRRCLIRLGFGRFFFVELVAISQGMEGFGEMLSPCDGTTALPWENTASVKGLVQMISLSQSTPVRSASDYYRKFLGHSRFFSDGVYNPKEIFVAVLRGARFHAESGVIALADNRLVLESALDEGRMRAMGPLHGFIPRSPKSVTGTCASIWTGWGNNYYHWWIDCLPRLYSLLQTFGDKKVTLLMPHDLRAFQKESLDCCLPENFQLRLVERSGWYRTEEFLLPSFVTWKACGYLPKDYLEFIRRRVFQSQGVPLEHQPRHNIYISRGKARWRRILNEDEVVGLLEDYGFRSYALEELSLRDKLELFRNANMVIGPNGAGFVNILFAGRIKILDILPSSIPETHIYFLSQSLGQRYYYMFGNGNDSRSDRKVDLKELRSAVNRMFDDPLA